MDRCHFLESGVFRFGVPQSLQGRSTASSVVFVFSGVRHDCFYLDKYLVVDLNSAGTAETGPLGPGLTVKFHAPLYIPDQYLMSIYSVLSTVLEVKDGVEQGSIFSSCFRCNAEDRLHGVHHIWPLSPISSIYLHTSGLYWHFSPSSENASLQVKHYPFLRSN